MDLLHASLTASIAASILYSAYHRRIRFGLEVNDVFASAMRSV